MSAVLNTTVPIPATSRFDINSFASAQGFATNYPETLTAADAATAIVAGEAFWAKEVEAFPDTKTATCRSI